MIDVKNEIQYLIVTRLLSGMAREGFLTADELAAAQRLAVERYRPAAVWE